MSFSKDMTAQKCQKNLSYLTLVRKFGEVAGYKIK